MSAKDFFQIAFICAFALSCGFAYAQEGEKGAKNGGAAVPGPKMQFEETSYDFGTVPQGTAVKHVFKFKNVGTDTLRIAQVKTSCGCTAAESSKIIAPNAEGQIAVTYNTGSALGKTSKTVFVLSNDVEAKQRSVTVHGVIEAKKAPATESQK